MGAASPSWQGMNFLPRNLAGRRMGVRSSIQQSSVVLQGIVDTGPKGPRPALDAEATALALAAAVGVPESAAADASGGGEVGGAGELGVGGEAPVAGSATA